MLTSGQCRVAAYLTDGDVLCVECAEKSLPNFDVEVDKLYEAFKAENPGEEPTYYQERQWHEKVNAAIHEAEEREDLRPLIQYELDSEESWQEYGLSCGHCGEELVEAQPEESDIEQTEEAEDLDNWLDEEKERTRLAF